MKQVLYIDTSSLSLSMMNTKTGEFYYFSNQKHNPPTIRILFLILHLVSVLEIVSLLVIAQRGRCLKCTLLFSFSIACQKSQCVFNEQSAKKYKALFGKYYVIIIQFFRHFSVLLIKFIITNEVCTIPVLNAVLTHT